MKTLIPLLFLTSCYQRTQVLTPWSGSHPEDIQALRAAVDLVDSIAGCELLRIDLNGTPDLTFGSDTLCGQTLDRDNAQGYTVITVEASPQICVQSFYESPEVIVWGGDVVRQSWGAAFVVYLHEIGHAAGLHHTDVIGDIMYHEASTEPGIYDLNSLQRYVDQLRAAGNPCLAPPEQNN